MIADTRDSAQRALGWCNIPGEVNYIEFRSCTSEFGGVTKRDWSRYHKKLLLVPIWRGQLGLAWDILAVGVRISPRRGAKLYAIVLPGQVPQRSGNN